MMKEEVGPEEISTIVSKWTGIPVNKLQEEDRERLLKLKEELHQKVVGQDEACTVVANAVLRSRYSHHISIKSHSLHSDSIQASILLFVKIQSSVLI